MTGFPCPLTWVLGPCDSVLISSLVCVLGPRDRVPVFSPTCVSSVPFLPPKSGTATTRGACLEPGSGSAATASCPPPLPILESFSSLLTLCPRAQKLFSCHPRDPASRRVAFWPSLSAAMISALSSSLLDVTTELSLQRLHGQLVRSACLAADGDVGLSEAPRALLDPRPQAPTCRLVSRCVCTWRSDTRVCRVFSLLGKALLTDPLFSCSTPAALDACVLPILAWVCPGPRGHRPLPLTRSPGCRGRRSGLSATRRRPAVVPRLTPCPW